MTRSLLFILITIAQVHALELKTSDTKAHLVELYTSESCSSCPSAESWLNSHSKSDRLWKEIVPVEFHVDYWNHLSWTDIYSSKDNTQRQRYYNQLLGKGVYTPQVIFNAQDHRKWRWGQLPRNEKKTGILKVSFDEKTSVAKIEYDGKSEKGLICHGTYLGGGIVTRVKSGENSGETLGHEFVSLGLQSSSMKRSDKNKCTIKLEKKTTKNIKNYSVAFWVSESGTGKILQATGASL